MNNQDMNKNPIKQGDLVTVKLEDNNPSSNTYIVARKLDGECLLVHPLSPDCYILKKDEELNNVLAMGKTAEERQLEYCVKFQKYLDFNSLSLLTSLSLYFVVYRKFSAKQKKTLSDLCGQIATVYCNTDIALAIRFVNENKALLDDFNLMWYRNFRKIFSGEQSADSPGRRLTVFNITGYILAQLETH